LLDGRTATNRDRELYSQDRSDIVHLLHLVARLHLHVRGVEVEQVLLVRPQLLAALGLALGLHVVKDRLAVDLGPHPPLDKVIPK
jgi:hypothetical protein